MHAGVCVEAQAGRLCSGAAVLPCGGCACVCENLGWRSATAWPAWPVCRFVELTVVESATQLVEEGEGVVWCDRRVCARCASSSEGLNRVPSHCPFAFLVIPLCFVTTHSITVLHVAIKPEGDVSISSVSGCLPQVDRRATHRFHVQELTTVISFDVQPSLRESSRRWLMCVYMELTTSVLRADSTDTSPKNRRRGGIKVGE